MNNVNVKSNVRMDVFRLAEKFGHTWGQLRFDQVRQLAEACETDRGFAQRIRALCHRQLKPGPLGWGVTAPDLDEDGNICHESGKKTFNWAAYEHVGIGPSPRPAVLGAVCRPGGTAICWARWWDDDGYAQFELSLPYGGEGFGMRHLAAVAKVAEAFSVNPLTFALAVRDLIPRAEAFDAAEAAAEAAAKEGEAWV